MNWKGGVSVLLETTSGLSTTTALSMRTRSHSAGGYAPRGVHGAISHEYTCSSFSLSCFCLRRRRKKKNAIKRSRMQAAPMPVATPAIFPVLMLLLDAAKVVFDVFETGGLRTVVSAWLSVHETLGLGIEVRDPVLVAEPLLWEEVKLEREDVESLLEVSPLLEVVADACGEVGKVSCNSI